MFRYPRETTPCAATSELGRVLEPLPVLPWGVLAFLYLGCFGVRQFAFVSLTIPVLDKYGGTPPC